LRLANLSFGFLSSETIEIFDEFPFISWKGAILEKKQGEDREKIIDFEVN
jgi:hypothetical protein